MIIRSIPAFLRKTLFAFADEEKPAGGAGTSSETPPPANAPPPEPGGALEAGNFTVETVSSPDEVPPSFEKFDAKYSDGSEPKPREVTPKQPEPGEKVTPPRGPDGKFKKPGEEEPFPEIPPSKPAEKPAAKAPEAPAVKPPAPPAAPEVKAAPVEPKPVEKPAGENPDKDIDAIEVKPTASDKTKNDFKVLKDIAKSERVERRKLEAVVAELNKKTGDLPEDVKTKLQEAEELRKFRDSFELENAPKQRAAYTEKLAKAEDGILSKLMTDPRLKLSQERADKFKAMGWDTKEGQAEANKWIAEIRKGAGEMLAQQVAQMFLGRDKIISDRAAEIEEMRTNRDGYLKRMQDGEKNEYENWGKTADKTLSELAATAEWANYKAIPEGATPEQKAVLEAHNKRVKDEVVPAFNTAVMDMYGRKPAESMKLAFDAFRAREMDREVASMKTELTEAKARIAELEELGKGVRRITNIASADNTPTVPVPEGNLAAIAGDKEVDAEAALDAWRSRKQS